ncbi:MAG: cyanophycin synthetase [Burkholderiales bacterium]|nr:cyanophycin synthetase [Burkholderiales bacterium]
MKDIVFLRMQYLGGPSLWTYCPIIEAWVDIGELEDFPSNLIPGFYERLSAWLPGLIEHRCSYDERGGFLRRLEEGTWPAHILEHVTLELQGMAGMPGGFGRARETSKRGVYKVAVTAWHETFTRAALETARELVLAAMEDRCFDVGDAVRKLRRLADRHCLGPSTSSIVEAANARGIPTIRLNEGNLVQLGYGAFQRRIWTAETDATSAIAEGISRDKALTKRLLASCGVPVPEGVEVSSPEEAWEAAEEIGLPVVVKPVDGNHGRGVFTDLSTREAIFSAYEVAKDEGSGVIVEKFISGIEHRLLVVGGRLVAAAKGEETHVIGDGKSPITELLESQINSNPLRGATEDHPLNFVRIDSAANLELAKQGYAPDSVPEAGKKILIQRNGSVAYDVTGSVHPEVARAAALAARVVGLDIAGIDLLAGDISRPLEEQGGAIVEVNAGPGLLMHLKPAQGEAQPVGQAIVTSLFPQGENGRMPVVGICGTGENSLLAELVAWLMRLWGRKVGLACASGLFLGERRVEGGADFDSANRILMNRSIDAAVFENGPGVILSEGLAYDRCQVGVVTEIAEGSSMPEFDILDEERMVTVLRTQVDVVLASGVAVLNADDARVADMAKYSDGEVIHYSLREEGVQDRAGRCLFMKGNSILLSGAGKQSVLATILSPSLSGREGVALAGAAAAIALGIPEELIGAGIESFRPFSGDQ